MTTAASVLWLLGDKVRPVFPPLRFDEPDKPVYSALRDKPIMALPFSGLAKIGLCCRAGL